MGRTKWSVLRCWILKDLDCKAGNWFQFTVVIKTDVTGPCSVCFNSLHIKFWHKFCLPVNCALYFLQLKGDSQGLAPQRLWLNQGSYLGWNHSHLQPWSQGLEKIILYTFCPSLPLYNVDKTLSSNTSLHFIIFQHWKGEWGWWHLFCRYFDYNFMFLAFSNTICPRLSEFSYALNAQ